MSGALAMGSNKITGLGTPTATTDATNKTYVDGILGSATAAASSASAAATSASNAATSETNAASSASAAAADRATVASLYDNFDDRYLGAKASAPTLDNDGDALITGALYFNTTTNIMNVYGSSGWQSAGSAVNGTSDRQTYTATSGQTVFAATYDAGYVDVYLNGVKLLAGTDFTATNGTSIQLASGAANNDIVDIVAYGTFVLADHYSKSQSDARYVEVAGDTMTGNLDITGTLTSDGLTVDGSTTLNVGDGVVNFRINGDDANTEYVALTVGGANVARLTAGNATTLDTSFDIYTANLGAETKRATFGANGDISFYEDTGTTAKFYWDASAESLGIGTTDTNNGRSLVVHTPSTVAAGGTQASINNLNGNFAMIGYRSSGLANDSTVRAGAYQDDFAIYTGAAEALRIDANRNMALGTVPSSQWSSGYDAFQFGQTGSLYGHANAVTPATYLASNVVYQGTAPNYDDLYLTTGAHAFKYAQDYDKHSWYVAGTGTAGNPISWTTAMVIDADSNIGVGTADPQRPLEITGSGFQSSYLRISGQSGNVADANFAGIEFYNTDPSGKGPNVAAFIEARAADSVGSGGQLVFATASTGASPEGERASEGMRLNGDGRFLVGKTSSDATLEGTEIRPQGLIVAKTQNGYPLQLRRSSSIGTIIDLRYQDSSVGAIGVAYDDIYYGTGATALKHYNAGNAIHPYNASSNTNRDNAIDLGMSTIRFDDIYATNGTIQTSDQNEKQQIASLTDAEITAAKAISKLFKTFKWNDKVAEKGDAARTHTGVIAQQVEAAMTDVGLDAGDYAFFISTTWWETQTDVPAVEAVEEVLDEDGNVITEAVEGKEAYTRTDTYHTLEEAPEGATERNRKGIRYPQLLSFIGAATEQRLASIESRLDALEAN
jgi:hypothetical protein